MRGPPPSGSYLVSASPGLRPWGQRGQPRVDGGSLNLPLQAISGRAEQALGPCSETCSGPCSLGERIGPLSAARDVYGSAVLPGIAKTSADSAEPDSSEAAPSTSLLTLLDLIHPQRNLQPALPPRPIGPQSPCEGTWPSSPRRPSSWVSEVQGRPAGPGIHLVQPEGTRDLAGAPGAGETGSATLDGLDPGHPSAIRSHPLLNHGSPPATPGHPAPP